MENRRKHLSRPQKLLLTTIVIFYPVFHWLLNYFSPAGQELIESRILQIYLPAFLLQGLILAAIILVLVDSRENLASLGLRKTDLTWTNGIVGVIFLIAAGIFLNILGRILSQAGLMRMRDFSYVLPRTLPEKMIWIVLAATAGFVEELCFRGFVITRMARLVGSAWPGVIVSSMSFGISHSYQGDAGMVVIGVYGLLFSLLFLARGTLVPCIVAHALQDILALFGM